VDTRARARLIAQHVPYVHKLVGDYIGLNLSSHDLDDLAQEGIVGLIEAVDAFESAILPARRFRSYARHWITGRILKLLRSILFVRDNETPVGLHMPEAVDTIDRADVADEVWWAVRRLSPFERYIVILSDGLDGHRRQSAREISEECGLSAARIRVVRATAHRHLRERIAARRRA
jgi:RNA polymerase sigma factor (sigma-70 family)